MSRPFRLQPPKLSEDDVEAQCISILDLHRYKVLRLHAGVFKSIDGARYIRGVPKGTPDYVCVHARHRNFMLEVKAPGGKLSTDQELQITVIQECYGIPVVVVEHVEELCNFLATHERSP